VSLLYGFLTGKQKGIELAYKMRYWDSSHFPISCVIGLLQCLVSTASGDGADVEGLNSEVRG